ncbi:MAG: hypothetical protein KDA80_11470 [Planctomycetaceae bacterium]|nr:hypothetical protein [Planctomycetaceae bacterium]
MDSKSTWWGMGRERGAAWRIADLFQYECSLLIGCERVSQSVLVDVGDFKLGADAGVVVNLVILPDRNAVWPLEFKPHRQGWLVAAGLVAVNRGEVNVARLGWGCFHVTHQAQKSQNLETKTPIHSRISDVPAY